MRRRKKSKRCAASRARRCSPVPLGFSTSRTLIHKGADGKYVPGTFARLDEVFGIGRALGDAHRGVFQMTSNHVGMDQETVWMRKLAAETGQPVAFNVQQIDTHPSCGVRCSARLRTPVAKACHCTAHSVAALLALLFSWGGTFHPFIAHPSYQPLRKLSAAERYRALLDPPCGQSCSPNNPTGWTNTRE